MESFFIDGFFPNFTDKSFFKGAMKIEEGVIKSIQKVDNCSPRYILPGLIDSHVHIESSMLLPSEFGQVVSKFGTIAAIADPHEIANVCGINGIETMFKNALDSPIKIFFGAPSCVPATRFETSGANLDANDIHFLFTENICYFLSEVMNFPGVINEDPELIHKINLARKWNKTIDGHAPGLSGKDLQKYINAGISTDHECSSISEAKEKLALGMKIIIRNGSAARNLEVLHPLISEYPERLMFCTDDCHPDDLIKGHINEFVKQGIKWGYSIFDLLQIACINPVKHYGVKVGILRTGDPADFIIVKDLENFEILETWISGRSILKQKPEQRKIDFDNSKNQFYINQIQKEDIEVYKNGNRLKLIVASDGNLLTKSIWVSLKGEDGTLVQSSITDDILKLVIVNRYGSAPPAIAFIKGFGLNMGAMATSVAHDSHNILALGTNDSDILSAIHLIQENQGGLAVVNGKGKEILPLPIAGLMSDLSADQVAGKYEKLNDQIRQMGSKMKAPFMTLSFMALLVIPELKLSDKGLFDGKTFSFVPLMGNEE